MVMKKQDIISEINRLSAELPTRQKIASIAEHEGLDIAFNELTDNCCALIKAESYKTSKSAIKNLETVKNFRDYLREQKKTAENIEYRIAELRIELTRCQLDLFKDSKLATGIKYNDRELYTGDVFETRNKEYLMIIISEEYENSYAIVGTAFSEELALQYPKNREILKNTAYLGNMYNDDKLADFLAELQLQQEELQEKKNNTDDKPSDDSNDSDNKGDEEDRG